MQSLVSPARPAYRQHLAKCCVRRQLNTKGRSAAKSLYGAVLLSESEGQAFGSDIDRMKGRENASASSCKESYSCGGLLFLMLIILS